jgi:hypothetical protein
MAAFIRVKDYFINLDSLAYIKIDDDSVSFGFCGIGSPSAALEGQNTIRFEKGTHLEAVELKQLKEFISDLPPLDRVVII